MEHPETSPISTTDTVSVDNHQPIHNNDTANTHDDLPLSTELPQPEAVQQTSHRPARKRCRARRHSNEHRRHDRLCLFASLVGSLIHGAS